MEEGAAAYGHAACAAQEGETIDLTKEKDGGVMKKLLVKGKGWKRPEAGDEVFGESELRQTCYIASRVRSAGHAVAVGRLLVWPD